MKKLLLPVLAGTFIVVAIISGRNRNTTQVDLIVHDIEHESGVSLNAIAPYSGIHTIELDNQNDWQDGDTIRFQGGEIIYIGTIKTK